MSGPLPQRASEISSARLEAFSDGVMAVIITIMALELRAPGGTTFAALRHRLPEVLIYVLSFAFLGIYWNNHHHLLRARSRINGAVMWANLVLLFWLSLIPVVTEWVGQYYKNSLPAATYGFISLCAALSFTLLLRMIIRAEGPDSGISAAVGRDNKSNMSILLYMPGLASPSSARGSPTRSSPRCQ